MLREHAAAWPAALVLLLAPAVAADAQERPAVEVWGAFSGIVQAPSGALVSTYSPPLASGTLVSSSAGQTLTLDGNRGPGFQGGINWFPAGSVGLQVLVDRGSVDLSGANGPYTGSLTYISRPPPDYVPRETSTGFSSPWPNTTGSLTAWATCANAIVRTVATGRVSAAVSGGLVWYRLSGQAQPLGYTEYRLGGHSVLFSDQKELALALGPVDRAGFDVGGDVSIALSPRASVFVGFRYFDAGTADLAVEATGITNPSQVVFDTPLDDIQRQLHPTAARVDTSSSRIVIGLKITP